VPESHFKLEPRDGRPLVRVIGDVDFSTRPYFERVLAETDARSPLVVSFLECTFCDSSIIGTLVSLRESRGGENVSLLVAPKSAVARVFGLVGIDRIFTIASDEEALTAGT
jgi:anti-anti-sigma factor